MDRGCSEGAKVNEPTLHIEHGFTGFNCSFEQWPLVWLVRGYAVMAMSWSIIVDNTMYTVPAGTRSNFASIPWYARWLISQTDEILVHAAILHDYLVGEFGPQIVSWKQANEAMYVVMKAFSYRSGRWPRLKRHLVYEAVRFHAWLHRKDSHR